VYIIEILKDKCNKCRECLKNCSVEAIIERDDSFQVNLNRCIYCGICIKECPEGAIIEREV